MRSFLILCSIILSIIEAFAQPQTPITWSDPQILRDTCAYRTRGIRVHGDTLVALAETGASDHTFTCVSISGNNGVSWSPWHIFTVPYSYSGDASVAFTSQGIFCSAEYTAFSTFGLFRTNDLGQSWINPPRTFTNLFVYVTRHDTIFANAYRDSIFWLTNSGVVHRGRQVPNYGVNASGEAIATSAHLVHFATTSSRTLGEENHLWYSRAPLYQGDFAIPQQLDSGFLASYGVGLDFGDNGTGVMLLGVNWTPFAPMVAIMRRVSHDDGVTWSAQDSLTPWECGDSIQLLVRHRGHRWLVVWNDSTHASGAIAWTYKCSFSANNGQNWYPSQTLSDNRMSGTWSDLVFQEDNHVRLVSTQSADDQNNGCVMVEYDGQIEVDSLRPTVLLAPLPDMVQIGDTLHLVATAQDNDTLAEVRVVIADSVGTQIVHMERIDTLHFRGTWQVPHAGLYRYKAEAEDFWENVTSYPDTGWFSCHTLGGNSTGPRTFASPSSFSARISPNPTNGYVRIVIETSSKVDNAEAIVYNLLGEEMLRQNVRILGSQTVWMMNVESLASGLYLLRVTVRQQQLTLKLVVLK